MTQTRKFVINGRRYAVIYDEQGVIRIWYNNSVMGQQPILTGTRTYKKVMAAFAEYLVQVAEAAANFPTEKCTKEEINAIIRKARAKGEINV